MVINQVNQIRFFEETFLVANVNPKIVFKILFLTLNSANIDFLNQKLYIYTTQKAISITRCIKLVEKNEFAAAALDLKYETFIVHVASLASFTLFIDLDVYLLYRP